MFVFSIGFVYILSGCQRSQNMSRISEGYSIKSWFSMTQKNSSSGLAEKESDLLIFHCKIGQTEKAATKVVLKSFNEELILREPININKL